MQQSYLKYMLRRSFTFILKYEFKIKEQFKNIRNQQQHQALIKNKHIIIKRTMKKKTQITFSHRYNKSQCNNKTTILYYPINSTFVYRSTSNNKPIVYFQPSNEKINLSKFQIAQKKRLYPISIIKSNLKIKNISNCEYNNLAQPFQNKIWIQQKCSNQKQMRLQDKLFPNRSPKMLKQPLLFTKNITQKFSIIKKLGSGASGQVVLVRQYITKMLFAIKIIKKQSLSCCLVKQRLANQIKIQGQVNHRNIIKLYTQFSDQKNIYLVLQYAGECSLYDLFIEKQKKGNDCLQTSTRKIQFILRQICKGVMNLHLNNIIHRDLKLENIIINQDIVKIGDFGCAVKTRDLRDTRIGSLPYFSPEQFKNERYGEKKDIWSIGVLAYQLIFGSTPFQTEIIKMMSYKRYSDSFPVLSSIILQKSSKEASSFLRFVLDPNPLTRPSIQNVLSHSFLKI